MRRSHRPLERPSGRSRTSIAGFLVRLTAGWVAALIALALMPDVESVAVSATVWCVATMLRILNISCVIRDISVRVPGALTITIVPDCTPLMPTLLLCVAIAAFPASRTWKLCGCLAGAAVLWLFNLFRITTLLAISHVHPVIFNFTHVWFWQTVALVFVCGLFVAWMRVALRPRNTP